MCEQRGDSHAVEVFSIITGAITCSRCTIPSTMFHNFCFITKYRSCCRLHIKAVEPDPVNLAFSCVISLIKSGPCKLYNSVELYDVNSQSLKAAEGFEYGDGGQNNAA